MHDVAVLCGLGENTALFLSKHCSLLLPTSLTISSSCQQRCKELTESDFETLAEKQIPNKAARAALHQGAMPRAHQVPAEPAAGKVLMSFVLLLSVESSPHLLPWNFYVQTFPLWTLSQEWPKLLTQSRSSQISTHTLRTQALLPK